MLKYMICGKAEKELYRVLDYSHKNLLNVPIDIYNHAQTLEELYLDANQLKDLPKALFTLQSLRQLNISDNEIIALPPNVSNLVRLLEFDLSKNGFLELPDGIKGLKALESFDLSVNPLGRLPDAFTMLVNLKEVFLNDTFLDFLPANIGRMTCLEVLEVRDNHLTMLPKSMTHLQALRRFDLGHNEFSEIPEVIGSLLNLEELWLDGNEVKCVPPEIGNLKKLEYLDVSENKVEWLCEEIGGCQMLTDLYLPTNNLNKLPESLWKLKKLEILKVEENHLTYLPTSIGGLSSLRELVCSSNELETLPPGIGLLRNLQTLNADENYIESLPDEIGSCVGLTIVSLRQNRLVHLPDDFGRLLNLVVLVLSSNLLECLPYSLMKLKKLQALWLSENQAKPLIPLQTDWDEERERRHLTCYMFPQRPHDDDLSYREEEEEQEGDKPSFHASLFEEEWKKRTSVLFDIDEEEPHIGGLTRQPTPFPKDVRDRIQAFRANAIAKGHVKVEPQQQQGEMVEAQQTEQHSHDEQHSAPYGSHPSNPQQHMSDEEKELLQQLQNTPLNAERTKMQEAVRQYQGTVSRMSSEVGGGCYDDKMKLSSDSGLGSMQLNEEQTLWKNGYPTIHEQEDIIRVSITKTPQLGFSVSGGMNSPGNPFRPDDHGIFITKILPNGPAAAVLQPGDKLLEVNNIDFTNILHEQAVALLKSCQTVDMVLSRSHAADHT